MAFRELSEKELELLTDSQREAYEEQLAAYRERVRFVEQLERMEDTQIESYQPTLNPMPPVRKTPESLFVKSEYTVQKVPAVGKPVSKVRTVKIAPISEPQIPKLSAPAGIRVASVQKIEATPQELPAGGIVKIPYSGFKALEPVKAELQTAVKVQILTVNQIRAQTVQVKMEAIEKPKFKEMQMRTVEKIAVKPCSVAAPPARVSVPDMTEPTPIQAKLPQTAVSFAKAREYHITVPEMIALPEIAAIRCGDISYTRPDDFSTFEVNCVSVPVIPCRKHKATVTIRPEVPVTFKPKMKTLAYTAPEIQKTAGFVRVQPVRISERTFKPFVRTAPRRMQPEPVGVPKKNFEKVGYDVQLFPQTAAFTIPDPHSNESIQALLRSAKKQ